MSNYQICPYQMCSFKLYKSAKTRFRPRRPGPRRRRLRRCLAQPHQSAGDGDMVTPSIPIFFPSTPSVSRSWRLRRRVSYGLYFHYGSALRCVAWRAIVSDSSTRVEAPAIADYRSPRNATQCNAQP